MNTYFSWIAGLILVLLLLVNPSAAKANTGLGKEVAKKSFDGTVCYTVQHGDTLSEIAQMFNTNLSKIIHANNLKSTVIMPYQVLTIPFEGDADTIFTSRGNISREELLLLARAIHAEARGESFDGQVAVGAVILNRMHSPLFPNTIQEVILQRDKHIYQFTPVSNGTINLEPDIRAFSAASKALDGYDPTGGALFFYNPHIATDKWIKTLPVITKIGKHVFATKA